MSVVI
jgi:magnesium-transporting ATPase (P-type)